jgi:uncharacterized small protein (DUF1192 family)
MEQEIALFKEEIKRLNEKEREEKDKERDKSKFLIFQYFISIYLY